MKKQEEKQLHSSAEVSPVSRSRQQEPTRDLPTAVISGLKWHELFPNCTPLGCLGRMLPALSIWGSTKRFLTWNAKATMFKIHIPSKFVTHTSHELWIGRAFDLNHIKLRDVLSISMIP